jgi:hypothetical protein
MLNFVEDLEDFFLFHSCGKTLSSDSKRAKGYGCDPAIFDMCCDATYLMCVSELDRLHFRMVFCEVRVDLVKEAHCCVVEETTDNCGALDEPEKVRDDEALTEITYQTSGKADFELVCEAAK